MRIAGIQTDVTIGDVEGNIARLEQTLRDEVAQGTELTIFPECYTTGYCFDSLEDARKFAETVPGPSTDRIARIVQRADNVCCLRDARKVRLRRFQYGSADRA